ncbi:M23 family metallopeptidase [Sulfurimonas sp. C5]|uniref:peptidoglycan DD-metalloendopeptidase family protein n=1 Tax=Sulfurimonas sp. C5 TaxID=3036947 RepID=UPI002456F52D|nr:M23 family metallopeptidase [Sulfurimonas sp. C5]MDH4944989.1 M23 family metallopeptidase [Sulfurimonas sp. C5]
MDRHFTVTIHDENGVRQFNLHKFVKKALYYAAIFLLTLAMIAVGTILYLNDSVDRMQLKKDNIETAYNDLQTQNSNLMESMQKTQVSLVAKKEELEELSDSLAEIEQMIGLKPIDNETLEERVSLAKLSSSQRLTLLNLIPSGSPVEYNGITSKFGYRIHPTLNREEFHRGTDLKAAMNTPIYATADGLVEWAGFHKSSGYGNLIILEHVYGFKSYFGHLNKIVIKSGQFVKKGQLIGYTGNSGMSNGPHLHYEIRFIHRVLNPYYFVKWTQQNYNEIFEKEKKVPWQSLITATSRITYQPILTQQLSQLEQR